jgi:uridylate kinase
MPEPLRWKRVLLKVSGEAFSGASGRTIDGTCLERLAREIAAARALGVELAVVNGGGNILRGGDGAIRGVSRVTSDFMGMLATIMNSLALKDALKELGVDTRVCSAIDMPTVAEPYILQRAIRHLEKGRVVVLTGGSGHPLFTTDTSAALRGVEIAAQVLLKGTKVDGIYDKDPKRHKDAVRFPRISFEDVYQKKLQVMDRTAITMCQENRLPIVVFDMDVPGNLLRVLRGEDIGTLVGAEVEPD